MADTHQVIRASGVVLTFVRTGSGLQVVKADGTVLSLLLTEV